MLAEYAHALREHGIDYSQAIDRFGGNDALYERLVFRILEDSHCSALRDKLAEGDAQAAYREAHALKGIAGTLSCTLLYGAAARLSDTLRTGDLESARRVLPTVETAYEKAVSVLKPLACAAGGAK